MLIEYIEKNANIILSKMEDEYMLKDDLTNEEKDKVFRWLNENS